MVIKVIEKIGWVYESNREKVKQATKDLDDFYRDDALNDLQQTKDKELEVLDERINNWNKYLTALKQRYDAWQVQEEQKLLMELTNVKTEEELYQKILGDMLNYNKKAAGHYDDYIGIFENFLDDYKTNLEKLQELKELEREYVTPDYYINKNDNNFSGIYEEAIGNNSTKKTLDLSIDYSAEMEKAIAAGDLAQAKYLQTLRDQKADILYITLGQGNYRSNSKVISDAMEKFGMTSGGTVKNASTTTLDKSVDYALEIQKAIARGDYDSVKAYADLRTEKAGDKLGTGVYKSNKDIIKEALDYYGVRYTEDISNGIGYLANNGDAVKLLVQTGVVANEKLAKEYITASSLSYGKLTDSYNVQKDSNGTIIGMSAKADVTNAGITNTNDKLGLLNTGVDGINGGIGTLDGSINGLGSGLGSIDGSVQKNTTDIIAQIKATGADIVSAQGLSRDEMEEILANGGYIDFGTYPGANGETGHLIADPNKKAPVYNTVDEDPGVVGSKAWEQSVRDSYKQNGITYGYNSIDDYIASEKKKASSANTHTNSDGSSYTNNGSSYTVTTANGTTTTIKKTNDNSSIKSPSMSRNTDLAGQTVSVGGYTLTYNKNGYCTSKVKNKNKNKSYSDGLENGPVTYTGLAMLHGAPSAPEYVLNNDQAYNLLYNLSVAKNASMAEFESAPRSDGGVQYIVQGDIILEGIDDPSQFWQEVTTAMGNRWNVTKNK